MQIVVVSSWIRVALLGFALLISTAANDARPATFSGFPPVVLWAWESPQDLRALDSRRYAVAYLDQTVFVGASVSVRPRLQPIHFAPGARVIAVVRIEPSTRDAFDDALVAKTADAILTSAKPFVRALQIDFDATVSQRSFYRRLLETVRSRLRPGLPLSITALASWCANDDWISGLPVDEAVPMYFRMESGVRRVRAGWTFPVREPLCSTSAGLSTDEAWPQLPSGLRLYVFHPGAWNPTALANLDTQVQP